MTKILTKDQKSMLDEIKSWIKKNNYPPTIRELMENLGKNSPGSVHRMLKIIESKGYISTESNKNRTITIQE